MGPGARQQNKYPEVVPKYSCGRSLWQHVASLTFNLCSQCQAASQWDTKVKPNEHLEPLHELENVDRIRGVAIVILSDHKSLSLKYSSKGQ